MVAAALISAGATLLGGLFSKPKYVVPNYAGIRSGAEKAGFNPLTALTQGPAGAVMQSGMGSAIADAGLMLADTLAKSKKTGLMSKVQSENDQLRDKVTNLTLRPKVGGVYAQRQSVPSVPSALGVPDASVRGQGVSSVVSSQAASVGTVAADPVAPVVANTFQTYLNDGQSTDVPLGPDLDEVMSGAVIAANNKVKARLLNNLTMTLGDPYGRQGIEMPPGYVPTFNKSKRQRLNDYWSMPVREPTRELMAPRPKNYW